MTRDEEPKPVAQPKWEKLVRRGPEDFRLVGTTRDGKPVETRIGGRGTVKLGPAS